MDDLKGSIRSPPEKVTLRHPVDYGNIRFTVTSLISIRLVCSVSIRSINSASLATVCSISFLCKQMSLETQPDVITINTTAVNSE